MIHPFTGRFRVDWSATVIDNCQYDNYLIVINTMQIEKFSKI